MNRASQARGGSCRIIPVVDLLDQHVVRGIAGRRSEYRPLVSSFVASSDPLQVAQALIGLVQPQEFYVADLNAIQGGCPQGQVYQQLQTLGVPFWLDAGIRTRSQLFPLIEAGIDRIILGSETIESLAVVAEVIEQIGSDRIVFSLDLLHGQLMGDQRRWANPEPLAIVRDVVSWGVTHLILLDVGRVGTASGLGTDDLRKVIRQVFPQLELFVGGGIRNELEIQTLAQQGVQGVLVASALHDGSLGLVQ